jgi:hypothetical protein
MKRYPDLVAEFAEKCHQELCKHQSVQCCKISGDYCHDFQTAFESDIGKALVQEVAREAVANAIVELKHIDLLSVKVLVSHDDTWWKEFTKQKE